MKDFLTNYLPLVLLVLQIVGVLLSVIISIYGRKDKNVLSYLDKVIPEFVKLSEEKYGAGHGTDKMLYVLQQVSQVLSKVFNITNSSIYDGYVKKVVELILSTPQKKEKEIIL